MSDNLTSSESDPTVTSTSSPAASANGRQSRDQLHASQSITEHDVTLTTSATIRHSDRSVAVESLPVTTGDRRATITDDVGDGDGVTSQPEWWTPRPGLTQSALVDATPRLTDISLTTRHHGHLSRLLPLLPLALRSATADNNASLSAAVGSNMADRRAGSGLLREEVATVGAAVAGVLVFWFLLAFAMCAVVRLRKRQTRRQLRGAGCRNDVDAQTAMMEAMVRAELARGRSRVSGDSRVPPTYVNVSELLPRSSSSCDFDMSDLFHFVQLGNTRPLQAACRKPCANDVTSPGGVRPRDHFPRWQDGSRTMQATQWSGNDCRRPPAAGHSDHYCLLNGGGATHDRSDQLPCNGGALTKVKSLDSICKAAAADDEPTKHRQRPRRRRRHGVKRSASTSRCLVSATTSNKPTSSSVVAPANG